MAGIDSFVTMLNSFSEEGAGKMAELLGALNSAGTTAYAEFCNRATTAQSQQLSSWLNSATSDEIRQAASRFNSARAGDPAALIRWLEVVRSGTTSVDATPTVNSKSVPTAWNADPVVGSLGCKNAKLEPGEYARGLLSGDIPLPTANSIVTVYRTHGFALPRPRSGVARTEMVCQACGTNVPIIVKSRRRVVLFHGFLMLLCLLVGAGMVALYPVWQGLDDDTKKGIGFLIFYIGFPAALCVVMGLVYAMYCLLSDPFDVKVSIDTKKLSDGSHQLFAPK